MFNKNTFERLVVKILSRAGKGKSRKLKNRYHIKNLGSGEFNCISAETKFEKYQRLKKHLWLTVKQSRY